MHYEYSYAVDEGLGILAGLISGFPMTLLNIASYVLGALALYTIAQRRGIKNAWLAWVPVVNCWLIGSLSDQYRYVVKGEYKSKRISLLVLNIINSALILVLTVLGIAALVAVGTAGSPFSMMPGYTAMTRLAGLGIAAACLGLAVAIVSITAMVIRFMALNDIFHSMDPENGALFLVLSILFNVTEPFFLFYNRNKDLGMPPRRDQFVQQEPVWQEPQEPWEQEEKDYL